MDDDVKQKRFARPQGFLDLWRELRRILDAQGVATASPSDGGVIHGREIHRVRIGVEGNGFAVLLIPQDLIVEHDREDRQLVADNGLQLRPAMSESAIAAYASDWLGRLRKLGEWPMAAPSPAPPSLEA